MVMDVQPEQIANEHFDLVVIGSGFGSAFFLHEFLKRRKARALVLEWGRHNTHEWQLNQNANTDIDDESTYKTDNADKPWNYTIGLGGGTNCWFAQTPRFHPNDFRLKSTYGVGNDWPISYDELEPFYCDAEEVMSISGDPDMARMLPRSRPFPQPPHRMSTPDRMMKAAQPEQHFVMPTARARVATAQRTSCCANLRCWLCPVDAKFTANNGLMHVFQHPDVSVCLGAEVRRLDHAGGSVRSVTFVRNGKDYSVSGDLVILGANAIQSPAIMLRSGLGGEFVGLGLHESYGWNYEVYLDGVDNFDGSTITTGLNFGLYDGPHRAEHAAALVYFENRWQHGMRADKGRLRQVLPLVIVTENLLDPENRVVLDKDENAFVSFKGASDYATKGMAKALERLPSLLKPLPVEQIFDRGIRPTESHVQGTLRMGTGPADSVVDRDMIHHQLRNLVVVGTSTYPSCSCANPSLTAAALSLRAASRLA
jgi:choline dehydrogenase-like flavoprotein